MLVVDLRGNGMKLCFEVRARRDSANEQRELCEAMGSFTGNS